MHNVHCSRASQTSWTHAPLVSATSTSPCSAALPPSSSCPARCAPAYVSCFVCLSLLCPSSFCQDNSGLSYAALAPCWGGLRGARALRASSALGPQLVFFQLIHVCAHPQWAGLKVSAFICRLTNGISAEVRKNLFYLRF